MAPERPAVPLSDENGNAFRFRESSVADLLRSFAAGKEVPGSGSANALAAALGACLAASVAIKTYKATDTKYLHVQQTALAVERRATHVVERLLNLVDEDSAAFAPVIAIRRETGRIDDPILQDAAVRSEVAALRPATEIPLQIARLALEVGELALLMLDSGFVAARGESYTALGQSIAATDGAVFVAQLNIKTVRKRIARLNDPALESDWVPRMIRDLHDVRGRWHELRVREHLARTAADRDVFS